jgi:transposase, IS5 family
MGGHIVRTIGLQRAKVKIGLMNLVYNMIRLVQLIKLNVKVAEQALVDKHREVAPVSA